MPIPDREVRSGRIRLSDEMRAALDAGAPVVALESTVLAHGLPWPRNLEVGTELEAIIRAEGVVPATVAVIDGVPAAGLDARELRRVAEGIGVAKLSTHDLSVAVARRSTGATTVAATAFLARRAGIRVFATGGIGGVHHGSPADVSADLHELARTGIVVVCAGAKSVLDLPATREMLETLGVLVLGWDTDVFPGFHYRETGLGVDARVGSAAEVAEMWRRHVSLDLPGAIVLAVPVPADAEVPRDVAAGALDGAFASAAEIGIRGKDVTPFLLRELDAATGGAALEANVALLRNNARVAAAVAREIAG